MKSILDPDAKQHQHALQLKMQAFIRLMKSDDHNESHYWEYIKGMKFLLDNHGLQLQGHELKDVVKMIKPMIHDPECKFVHPTKSTKESDSNEGMPQEFDTPSKANIMAEFHKEMLTPEVTTNIVNIIEHMEASHSEAANLMKCMKKLISTIPVGAFHLILQAMVQNEAGIKVSIVQTAKLFGTQEKPFHQALKGVCYESSTQKHRHLDAACAKDEESPSSETKDDDDDDKDESAVTKIKPLKKHKK